MHLTTGWSSLALVLVSLGFVQALGCIQESPSSLEIDPGNPGEGGSGNSGSGAAGNTGNASGVSAKDFFLDTVYPALATEQTAGETPDCASCHATGNLGAPPWLASNAEDSYEAVDQPKYIAIPDNSLLVQHGVHTGPALTLTQEDLVIEWLLLEVEERGLAGGTTVPGDPPPPVGKTLTEALAEFAECMTLESWNLHGMDQMAGAQTGSGGPCEGCHQTGQAGTWLSASNEETYDRHQDMPFIKRLVTGTINEQGQFETLIPANRYQDKGQAPCSSPTGEWCHPKYSLPPILTAAVEGFVDETIAKWAANECTPLPPDPDPEP